MGGGSEGEATHWGNSLTTSVTQLRGDRLSAELGSWVCYDLGSRSAGWGVIVIMCVSFVMFCSQYKCGSQGDHSHDASESWNHKQARCRSQGIMINPEVGLGCGDKVHLGKRSSRGQWDKGVERQSAQRKAHLTGF